MVGLTSRDGPDISSNVLLATKFTNNILFLTLAFPVSLFKFITEETLSNTQETLLKDAQATD